MQVQHGIGVFSPGGWSSYCFDHEYELMAPYLLSETVIVKFLVAVTRGSLVDCCLENKHCGFFLHTRSTYVQHLGALQERLWRLL